VIPPDFNLEEVQVLDCVQPGSVWKLNLQGFSQTQALKKECVSGDQTQPKFTASIQFWEAFRFFLLFKAKKMYFHGKKI